MKDYSAEVEKVRREKFEEYRQRELFTDVTLIAVNRSGDEVKFHLQRAILAAVSHFVIFNFCQPIFICRLKVNLVRNDVLPIDD